MIKKAFMVYGFLVKNTKLFNDKTVINRSYKSLALSRFKYTSIFWSPIYIYYEKLIEKVQSGFLYMLHFRILGVHLTYDSYVGLIVNTNEMF